MDEYCSSLINDLKKINNTVNAELIEKAYDTMKSAHEGQYRVSGEPYYMHPYEVAKILCGLGMDDVTISAALLHDVIEDTPYNHEELEAIFGSEIIDLVEGVTKLGKIPYSSKEEQQIENLRKMFMAMAKDIRVVLIKLADRLHNMRTMKSMPDHKRREKALETMEIYAPLAHRLGISSVKWELEDLSLMYLDPIAYKEITVSISQKREERLAILQEMIEQIKEKFKEENLSCSIEGRIKHFYSIYRKLYYKNKTMDTIYDLFAIRIIVENINDCYTALGICHEMYKPMPGRFKDYISMPKKNMYQSLHSTLIGKNGVPFEIQIRTQEMHKTAEYGIAAHWKYKEGKTSESELDSKLTWVRQLLEVEKDANNPSEFISNLKIDLFSDEVFVFTPKGDVISLPSGANPIDFAFAIHTAVGWKMTGAKINGKIMPLDTQLHNGDIVDIITSSNGNGPGKDWVKIAKTSQARSKINQWFKKENRDENIEKGKLILEKELKQVELSLGDFLKDDIYNFVLKRFSYQHRDDFFASIAYGGVSVEKVMNRVKDFLKKKNEEPLKLENLVKTGEGKKTDSGGIQVKGIDNCLIKFAKCCNPVPGDDIIGYITRGRGVSVHRADCSSIMNIEKADGDAARLIEVSWGKTEKVSFNSELLILADDRSGLLMDLTLCLNELKIPLRAVTARTNKDLTCAINVTLEIKSTAELYRAVTKIKAIKDVISVSRTSN
ncbi:MAG: bifunctional (p)ppGpp synthetase/guanosine-3',5'-bis(diphosphate) 3'-pyrophosphohydrolase [Clostridia bacterium]|nr:bifunctional (p)ppGpp synthetase/guanosine-3',5'-bis(diphosphate) 3'-pyrophosphohydrolase [Clostridia bacterium]